ncbi:DUF2061 domain-containing protein, partial [Vibrio parahaemolyticus]
QVLHFSVCVIAMLEPSLNTVAYYFHEKVWLRKSSDESSAPHFCFHKHA